MPSRSNWCGDFAAQARSAQTKNQTLFNAIAYINYMESTRPVRESKAAVKIIDPDEPLADESDRVANRDGLMCEPMQKWMRMNAEYPALYDDSV